MSCSRNPLYRKTISEVMAMPFDMVASNTMKDGTYLCVSDCSWILAFKVKNGDWTYVWRGKEFEVSSKEESDYVKALAFPETW